MAEGRRRKYLMEEGILFAHSDSDTVIGVAQSENSLATEVAFDRSFHNYGLLFQAVCILTISSLQMIPMSFFSESVNILWRAAILKRTAF